MSSILEFAREREVLDFDIKASHLISERESRLSPSSTVDNKYLKK